MKIKGHNVNVNALLDDLNIEHDFYMKRKNGLLLRDSQIDVLERYHIFYQQFDNISSLIFRMEEVLNEMTDAFDLERVCEELSEMHYYQKTNQ